MRNTNQSDSNCFVSIEDTPLANTDISVVALRDLPSLSIAVCDIYGTQFETFSYESLSAGDNFAVASKSVGPNHAIVKLSAEADRSSYAKRVLRLEGADNFRDFGGYQPPERVQMPLRRYFRSENLGGITPDGFRALESLGIERIFDLRRGDEIALAPTLIPDSLNIELINVPISGQIFGFDDALVGAFSNVIDQITITNMVDMYDFILDNYLDELVSVASQILAPARGASLVHCTAGKDRTGLVAALVQLAHGVTKQDIYYDYLLSNRLRTPGRIATLRPQFERRGLDISKFKYYFSAPFQALDENFDRLTEIATKHLVAP